MASSGLSGALSERAIRDLASQVPAGRTLPAVFLQREESDSSPAVLVQCLVVYVRTGGFMLALPAEPDGVIRETIAGLPQAATSAAEPIFHSGEVPFETTRGRRDGNLTIELVDLPWEFASAFVTIGRLSSTQKSQLVGFLSSTGVLGRPVKTSVIELAQEWLDIMEPLTAQDYFTGEEAGSQYAPSTPELRPADPGQAASEVDLLKARIAELESMQSIQALPQGPSAAPPRAKAPPLLGVPGSSAQLSQQEWGKLQLLAGSPPPRAGAAEKRRQLTAQQTPAQQDLALVDLQREAAEEEQDAVDPVDLEALLGATSDPLQKMLMVQMQQNQALLQKLVGSKSSDPVLGALQGGGLDSGSGGGSSSGVKGCMAREAFLRAVADLPKVANSTRANALRELGMDPSREDGSLIRRYMERRMPLAEHRLLTYFTAMLAEAWAVGYNSGNVEMLGILSRMLFFTEQCSIDQGRTSMAWLLAGWQEPPFHLLTSAKRHPGLQPYARLCHPAWVSANIAYVKDIDYLEGRLQSLGTSKPKKTQDDSDYQTKQNPKLKPRKPKGTGKGGRQDAASTDAGSTTG